MRQTLTQVLFVYPLNGPGLTPAKWQRKPYDDAEVIGKGKKQKQEPHDFIWEYPDEIFFFHFIFVMSSFGDGRRNGQFVYKKKIRSKIPL